MSEDEQPRGQVTVNGYRTHGYYIRNETHERLKGAWWGARHKDETVPASLSALVDELLDREARRLEEVYNAGDEFPRAPRNARGVDPAGIQRQASGVAGLWQRQREESARALDDEQN